MLLYSKLRANNWIFFILFSVVEVLICELIVDSGSLTHRNCIWFVAKSGICVYVSYFGVYIEREAVIQKNDMVIWR